MTRIRTSHIVIAAVAASIAVGSSASVALAGPPAPCLNCGSGGGGGGGTTSGGGGGSTTTTPPSGGGGGGTTTPITHPTPPAVTAVATAATAPRVITVRWHVPGSNTISGVIVRRGVGSNCPTSTSEGIGVGGGAKRSSQVDKGVKAGGTYCYSVFTTSPYHSSAAAHDKAVVGPPAKATHVTVGVTPGKDIVVKWHAAAGATGYVLTAAAVSNGAKCPTMGSRRIGVQPGKTTAIDNGAQPGTSYCYAVFSTNGTKFHSARSLSQDKAVAIPLITTPAPTSSSSSMFSSSLAKIVGGVALAVLLLAALAFVAVKLISRAREDDWQYSQHSHRGGRVSIGRYEGGAALVIPAAIAVVSLVLLIAAALSL
jgi:hypothetical protein